MAAGWQLGSVTGMPAGVNSTGTSAEPDRRAPEEDGRAEPAADGLDNALPRALWQAQHAVEQAWDAALAPLGMTTTLAGTLAFLGEGPGQSAADIARRARVTPQSVAKALARLERLGLVSRAAHPVHGRIQRLYLTERGEAMLAATAEVTASMEARLRDALAEPARAQLLAALTTLRERANALLPGEATEATGDS
jgi:DNA-binding MarR family transcriptional regulator